MQQSLKDTQRRRMNPIAKIVSAVAAALSIMLPGASPIQAAPVLARSSDGFVDTIGVNVHSSHLYWPVGTAYDNWSAVTTAIGDLGVRYVRDIPSATARLNSLYDATGAKVDVLVDGRGPGYVLDPALLPSVLASAKALKGIVYLEGANEYDQAGDVPSDPNWKTTIHNWTVAMSQQIRADATLSNYPIIAPSPETPENLALIGDHTAYVDLGNIHSYPNAHPATNLLAGKLSNAAVISGNKPVVATETGYHSHSGLMTTANDISLAAGGKYFPRLLMEYFRQGIQRTFLYELVDDFPDPAHTNSEYDLGLLNNDFTAKPAATSVKNLIHLLKDPGTSFTPSTLNYTLTGGNADLRQVLLQKSDGTYWLALWQNVSVFDNPTSTDLINPDLPVTLTLGSAFASAATYLPDGSINPTATFGPGLQLNLNVPDQVLLVEITPTPEPASALALAGAALLLFRRRK